MNNVKKSLIFGLIIGAVIAFVISLIGAQIVQSTSKPEFCASCHEMKPMYETWLKGPHGPLYENGRGVERARCVDCHLPHGTNVINYLIAKGISGTKDFVVHITGPGRVDWEKKLDEPQKYVYVKSCLHCHTNLTDAPGLSDDAKEAHKEAFQDTKYPNCLDCHDYAGHGEDFADKLQEYLKKK